MRFFFFFLPNIEKKQLSPFPLAVLTFLELSLPRKPKWQILCKNWSSPPLVREIHRKIVVPYHFLSLSLANSLKSDALQHWQGGEGS